MLPAVQAFLVPALEAACLAHQAHLHLVQVRLLLDPAHQGLEGEPAQCMHQKLLRNLQQICIASLLFSPSASSTSAHRLNTASHCRCLCFAPRVAEVLSCCRFGASQQPQQQNQQQLSLFGASQQPQQQNQQQPGLFGAVQGQQQQPFNTTQLAAGIAPASQEIGAISNAFDKSSNDYRFRHLFLNVVDNPGSYGCPPGKTFCLCAAPLPPLKFVVGMCIHLMSWSAATLNPLCLPYALAGCVIASLGWTGCMISLIPAVQPQDSQLRSPA